MNQAYFLYPFLEKKGDINMRVYRIIQGRLTDSIQPALLGYPKRKVIDTAGICLPVTIGKQAVSKRRKSWKPVMHMRPSGRW